MLQLVLEFFQAIISKTQEKFNPFVDGLRVANLVCFHRREVILLLLCTGAQKRRRNQEKGGQKQKLHFDFHGCFSAGGVASGVSSPGAASCFSTGLRGKSHFPRSSSLP